jgi:hypothetical protein
VIIEPIDDTIFQPINASGYAGTRLGIPASPKKCIGKNVKLTPIKNDQKCACALKEL